MGIYHTYYEVKLCKPRIKKLRILLDESAYRGAEMESGLIDSNAKFYSTADLLLEVQASEAELLTTLKELFAFELDGKSILYFDFLDISNILHYRLFC